MLRIFLDTANVEEIKDAAKTGLIHGIATNPDKISGMSMTYRQVVDSIREHFDGPIALQALGGTTEELCQCAREIHQLDPLLAVKIPANEAGLAALTPLIAEGVRTNATLIFSATQGLLAGLAGSPFISPFIGRARMAGIDGIETISQIRGMYDRLAIQNTCIIAASIKDTQQVVDAVLAGAHSVAVTYPIFQAMCRHPLTEQGLEEFTRLYEKSNS